MYDYDSWIKNFWRRVDLVKKKIAVKTVRDALNNPVDDPSKNSAEWNWQNPFSPYAGTRIAYVPGPFTYKRGYPFEDKAFVAERAHFIILKPDVAPGKRRSALIYYEGLEGDDVPEGEWTIDDIAQILWEEWLPMLCNKDSGGGLESFKSQDIIARIDYIAARYHLD